jgi:hypothetical protein
MTFHLILLAVCRAAQRGDRAPCDHRWRGSQRPRSPTSRDPDFIAPSALEYQDRFTATTKTRRRAAGALQRFPRSARSAGVRPAPRCWVQAALVPVHLSSSAGQLAPVRLLAEGLQGLVREAA